MVSLPLSTINTHFKTVEEEVKERWDQLTKTQHFPLFTPGRSDASILQEYEALNQFRKGLAQGHPLFKTSPSHVQEKRYRYSNCITFEHSATCHSYNSTSIAVGRRRFFALEGPLPHHVPYFLDLLERWNVAQLVCLTSDQEEGVDKCHPYWEEHSLSLPFEFWPQWKDNQTVPADRLVARANLVRSNLKNGAILAVHCSAGVGRTGTFISTIGLLDAIDAQGTEISIPEIFLYLNFHRPQMVGNAIQYLTLYRVVEHYTQVSQSNDY